MEKMGKVVVVVWDEAIDAVEVFDVDGTEEVVEKCAAAA